MTQRTTYNERAWAMDLAKAGSLWIEKHRGIFTDVGGEKGLKVDGRTLFPDLLLYTTGQQVILGVELKFPDTESDNAALLENSTKKANALGLNHTLTWNVNHAVLWNLDGERPTRVLEWRIASPVRRGDVNRVKAESLALFETILDQLDAYFQGVNYQACSLIESLGLFIGDFVKSNVQFTAEAIERTCNQSTNHLVELGMWWASNSGSWPKELTEYEAKAHTVLFTKLSQLVVAHQLCSKPEYRSLRPHLVGLEGDLEGFQDFFQALSERSNLGHVFKEGLFDQFLSSAAVHAYQDLNLFLGEAARGQLDATTMTEMYHSIVERDLRKAIGQFATPSPLARLLLYLSMPGERSAEISFLDPCCGTATFASEAVQIASGAFPLQVFASDKFTLPTLVSMLRLLPFLEDGNLNLYTADVFQFGESHTVQRQLGSTDLDGAETFDWICLNPPFVRQEHVDTALEPYARKATINANLNKRSDLSAYVILQALQILKEGGRLGFIVPNSIINTVWGETFLKELRKQARIDTILRSTDEKWFAFENENEDVAQVRCVALVVTKRLPHVESGNEIVTFATQTASLRAIDEMANSDLQKAVLMSSIPGHDTVLKTQSFTWREVEQLKAVGVGLNAVFEEGVKTLLPLFESLRPISELMTISRGERRGWNPLFYPKPAETRIEAEYLRPLIKSSREIQSLVVAAPRAVAFCCSKTKEQLSVLGHTGALDWIERFEHMTNGKGQPLPQVLAQPNRLWYEISEESATDFVMSMNPDQRHMVAWCREPAVVDQRLIAANIKQTVIEDDDQNRSFIHAVLNSSLSYLYFELIGFGRGLGALDLSANKIAQKFRIFDPTGLTSAQKQSVIETFRPLLERSVMKIDAELKQEDRLAFETALFSLFGVEEHAAAIRYLLQTMVAHRRNVAGR